MGDGLAAAENWGARMGTVMFASVGQAVGGPLAAAVGAAVGGTIDGALFARRQPAASDAIVQKSAYGEVIPRLYGRVRVAGHLIWATPMTARATKNGGGRAYVASLAIAVSARPILDIGRIWADGREIRNAAGVFEEPTGMRAYPGTMDQVPDPLIAAAEGAGRAPAYRGIAYLVLEDFNLAAFGNRVPNLTFEVLADDGRMVDWMTDLMDGAIGVETDAPDVDAVGFIGSGERAADLGTLMRVGRMVEQYRNAKLWAGTADPPYRLPLDEIVMAGSGGPDSEHRAAVRPAALELGHADPDRDFQPGRQRDDRSRSGETVAVDLPIAMTAVAARGLCGRWLKEIRGACDGLRLRLPWRWAWLAVGDRLVIGDDVRVWRIVQRTIEGLGIDIEAEGEPAGTTGPSAAADGGRVLSAPLVPPAPTQLELYEPPVPIREEGAAVWALASGTSGWRGAELSLDTGSGEQSVGRAVTPLAKAVLLEAGRSGPTAIWDEATSLRLRIEAGPEPESRAVNVVLAGANLLKLNDELIQFRSVETIGAGEVILRGLLRGQFGTDRFVMAHPAGSTVWFLQPEAMIRAPIAPDFTGRDIHATARSAGDPAGGSIAGHRVSGAGHAPLAPAHVAVARQTGGDLAIGWVSRSRSCWDWNAGEPASGAFLVHVRCDGEIVTRRVEGRSMAFAAADQLAVFGRIPDRMEIMVAADGPGPLPIRATGWLGF